MSRKVMTTFTLLLGVMLLAGCASPPEQEMQQAQEAVSQARELGAEQYVSDQFRQLADSLNAAMAEKQEEDSKFALFRDYDDAAAKFQRVEEMAEDVIQEAEAEREQVRDEVVTMVDSVGTLVEQAQTALNRAPRGKDNKAELELIKNELSSLAASYEDARTDIDDGKYSSAKAKLDSVMEGTQRIIDEIKAARGRR